MKCSTHRKDPFAVLFTPTAVKVAEIVPWIHNSWVKPASLKWECITDPVSPYKTTFKTLAPFPNRTCFPGDNRKPWTTRHQPCSSHSRSWLVYAWWKLEESPTSPLRIRPFCVFFLLLLVNSLPGDPQALDCDSCMHTTQAGSTVTKTLVFHIYYSSAGSWVMHPQPYHLLSVLSWWSVYLF
jgi:hypothetical protein